MSNAYRIEVTYKGETGYLLTETGPDLRTSYAVVMTEARASIYRSERSATRALARAAARFDSARLVSA